MVSFFGLKRYDVELSPPVKGRITDNGEPVAGIEVKRRLFYSGYSKEAILDYAKTNDNGEFEFDEKIVKSRSPGDIFGQNSRLSQEINIKKNISDDDDFYWLWATTKNWSSTPLLNILLSQLNADLKNKEVLHLIDLSEYNDRTDQPVASICHWQKDYITTYYQNEIISSYDEIN